MRMFRPGFVYLGITREKVVKKRSGVWVGVYFPLIKIKSKTWTERLLRLPGQQTLPRGGFASIPSGGFDFVSSTAKPSPARCHDSPKRPRATSRQAHTCVGCGAAFLHGERHASWC